MCGRMVALNLKAMVRGSGRPLREVMEDWGGDRYNLAPSQSAVTIHLEDGEWVVSMRRWGLIPSWSKVESIGVKLINARAETVAEKPSFRAAFKRGRVLIPVSGFYEWAVIGGRKRPYFIHPADPGSLWFFAGLAESWKGPAGPVESFTVVTTEANRAMAELHHRMPVILGSAGRDAWLGEDTPAPDLQALLKPCPDDWLEAYEVGPAVGNVRNEGPELIEPVA